MNTRRIPFQFSSTDPLARQRELEKRFGLQPTSPKMYVDVNNPLLMGTTKETSSPRLQHRVPIFAEGYDQPIHSSSVDSMASVPDNKKPNVRVIPIEIEGADNRSRHRTFSGPADTVKDRFDSLGFNRNEAHPFKRCNFGDLSRPSKPKHIGGPRILNIPVQVEDNLSRSPKIDVAKKPKMSSTANGGSQLNLSNKVKPVKIDVKMHPDLIKKDDKMQPEQIKNDTDHHKNNVEILIKKIDDVLAEFKTYETEVVEFNGTSKDKQYRYLDEMLTRCMLRLDDIDTMGNEEIRLSRKNAVKKIQASIDLLESKANIKPVASNEESQVQPISNQDNLIEKDNIVEMKENKVKDNSAESDEIHSEISDKINNDSEIEGKSKELSNEMTSLQNSSNVAEMELSSETTNSCELPKPDVSFEDETNSTKISDEAKNANYGESSFLQQQQNNVPEMQMSEEISSISTNTQPPQISSLVNDHVEQNEDCTQLTNDVEMDDNITLNVVEITEKCLSLDETADKGSPQNVSNDVPDVEMTEITDSPIHHEETGEKIEPEPTEEAITHSPECSDKTNNSVDLNVQLPSPVSPKDAEMKEIEVTESTTGDICDLSEQDDSKFTTSPKEHNMTVDIEPKNSNISAS